jgi:Na+/proline symporter
MHTIDWLITVIPVAIILCVAVYSKRYIRGVVDYLAAGRVAGRYVISVGDLSSSLGVITLVALVEMKYQVGYALTFWEYMVIPVYIIMGLTGYCTYRFRETKSLSIGQFLEMRYSRSFRIIAASVRTVAEMFTNAIGPAIAANFFIYFLNLPHRVTILGMNMPTFGIVVAISLSMAIIIMWPAGRMSLLITDAFQGIISYPIFVIIGGYVLVHFSWNAEIAPVMLDRVHGESFLNPFDISELRDFNIFALFVTVFASILNKASWIGGETSGCGRDPHEQKMAGILGSWRAGFSGLMCLLVAVMIITVMTHSNFSEKAYDIRQQLSQKVTEESVQSTELRTTLDQNIASIPATHHEIGVDAPLSRDQNIDTPYMEMAQETLGNDGEGNLAFQKYRTLYNQMMMPIALRNMLPVGVMGLFCLLMVMLMLSTDDTRIFNSSSTIVQDIIQPLLKNKLSPEKHLLLLRCGAVGVSIFFFICSIFFVHLDYINMFITIMCAVWLGGAGPVMIFGLYSKFGTTTGAYCALIAGSGISVVTLFLQRHWAESVYPFLVNHGWAEPIGNFLVKVSSPFSPYIEWKMDAIKFPINSYESYFFAMVTGVLAYLIGSWITYKEPYNMDRLLHRGEYSIDGVKHIKTPWTLRNFIGKVIGITPDYTRGDKIIAWSVFSYAIIYKMGFCFLFVLIWNLISPWPESWWSDYFFITTLVITGGLAIITTFWFLIGGIIDTRRLFIDLADRVDNPLDDGSVVGHVSLADKAVFEAETHKPEDD